MLGPPAEGPGGSMGWGGCDIDIHIDINMNIDIIHIIINMNIEDNIIYYLLYIPYWLFPVGYSLVAIP